MRRILVCLAGLVIVLVAFLALRAYRTDPPTSDHGGWRAEPEVLVRRVEQLAGSGEVDAAGSVLAALLERAGVAQT
nr:hypothetical protein [Planctomycetota bacterium]